MEPYGAKVVCIEMGHSMLPPCFPEMGAFLLSHKASENMLGNILKMIINPLHQALDIVLTCGANRRK